MEIGLLYEVFTDDLEEPVSQFEDAQSSSSQDLSTSSNTRGFDTYPTIRMATTQLKSNLSHPTYEFTTLGPAFTSTSAIPFFCISPRSIHLTFADPLKVTLSP